MSLLFLHRPSCKKNCGGQDQYQNSNQIPHAMPGNLLSSGKYDVPELIQRYASFTCRSAGRNQVAGFQRETLRQTRKVRRLKPGQSTIGNHTERIDIATLVCRTLPLKHLRRHKGWSSYQRGSSCFGSQSDVPQNRYAVNEKDILRLDVPMDQPCLMQRGNTICQA